MAPPWPWCMAAETQTREGAGGTTFGAVFCQCVGEANRARTQPRTNLKHQRAFECRCHQSFQKARCRVASGLVIVAASALRVVLEWLAAGDLELTQLRSEHWGIPEPACDQTVKRL